MRCRQEEVNVYEELRHHGTPLDETIYKKAREESRGLEIKQIGDLADNLVYSKSGGLGVTVKLLVQNNSDRTIKLTGIRLRMPWTDTSFHLLKKQSPKALNRYGRYVLSACGPDGFPPSLVLNHILTPNFKLHPGDAISGFLLGQSTSRVPVEYNAQIVAPMQVIVFVSPTESYRAWVTLGMMPYVETEPEVRRPRVIAATQDSKVLAKR